VVEFSAWKAGQVSPSRQEIAITVPRQRGIKLEPISPRLKKRLPHPNAGSTIVGLRYSPDGKRIIAGDYPGGVVQVWDAETGKGLTRIETGPRQNTHEYFFVSPDWKTIYAAMKPRDERSVEWIEKDGKKLARWRFRGEVRAWDLDSGQVLASFKHTPERRILDLRLSPDASTFVTREELPGDWEPDKVKACSTIWDSRSGRGRPLPDDISWISRFAPDGRSFAATTLDADGYTTSIKIIDVATLETRLTIPITQERSSAACVFTPDGRVMIGDVQSFTSSSQWRTTLIFWEAATGRQLASFPAEDKNADLAAHDRAFSPDGRYVVVTYSPPDKGAKVHVVEAATGKLARTINFEARQSVWVPVYSPNGRWLAVSNED
jgi:WD40 repeat protein